jgi:hypothetical protein
MRLTETLLGILVAAALTGAACSGGGGGGRTTCNPSLTPTGCSGDFQCEVVTGGVDAGTLGRCFPPAYLDVTVLDPTQEDKPVVGARVVVTDADTGAAAGPAGTTSSGGVARVPVVWPRSEPDTTPAHSFNIRVSAVGYLEYPGAARASIPVSVQRDPLLSLDPAQATIRVLPFANPPKGAITGTVVRSDAKTPAAGVLVVAEDLNASPPVGLSAVSDSAGGFAIFNVESRSYSLSAYFAGMSFPTTPVSVSGAEVHAPKIIADATPALANVTGQVEIVSAASRTSATVVLRIPTTYDVVPGLRAAATSGAPFTIAGAATGTYQAVAGWGIDGLVLDPDTNIGQTGYQEVSVLGTSPPGTAALLDHFKVTDAVTILGPGQSGDVTLVNGVPTFRWQKYPQAEFYIVKVWDGMSADPTWIGDSRTTTMTNEQVAYPGTPALVSGFFYQWWVEAWTSTPTERQLSHSEDQLGVFEYVAQE